MNAIPRVLPAQPTSEATQLNPGTPAAASAPGSGSQDFAGALSDAAGTPVHKNMSNKAGDANRSGAQLPPAGNHSPPSPAPVPPAAPQTLAAPAQPVAAAVDVGAVLAPQPNGTAASQPPVAPAIAPGAIEDEGEQGSSAVPVPALSSASEPAQVLTPLPVPVPATTAAAGAAQAARETNEVSKTALGAAPRDGSLASAPQTASTRPTLATAPAAPGNATTANGDATPQSIIAAAVVHSVEPGWRDAPSTPDEAAATPAGMQSQGAVQVASPAAAVAVTPPRPVDAAIVAAAGASAGAFAGAAEKHATVGSVDSSSAADPSGGQAMAAQLVGGSSASADTAAVPTLKVAAAVDSNDFGQGVADRVSLMVDNNLTNARLQVNPPSLGPIEVRIALQDGHAQVWLTSHSAVTRDALELGSPQLREMLGAQGFSHVSVDISQRSFQERSAHSQTYEAAPAAEHSEKSALAPAAHSITRAASGVVDAYA